jgi:hypothetical protein
VEGFFEENLDCPADALTPKALRPAVEELLTNLF